MKIYLIGSLRNLKVPTIAYKLREAGYEVFDDWFAAGPEADDYWQAYEKGRGHSYKEALAGLAAEHVFNFDKKHLDSSDVAVLVMPAGKSGFLELGYMIGSGKPGFILLDGEPERYDVMFKFARVVDSVRELTLALAVKKQKQGIFTQPDGFKLPAALRSGDVVQKAVLHAFGGKLVSQPFVLRREERGYRMIVGNSNAFPFRGEFDLPPLPLDFKEFTFRWNGRRDSEGNMILELGPEFYK